MRAIVTKPISNAASVALVLAVSAAAGPSRAAVARPDERGAIMRLLDTYATAVTHKDRATFETLLLSKDIPFAYVSATPTSGDAASWRDYDGFRRSVFEGPSFTQRFEDVTIRQHGALADVDLVYVNRDTHGSHPGWKTMQLLKVDGQWKIASEFFTGLRQPAP